MPTYDVARARISKPRFQVCGLQGEGNVGEARAAARRTRSPTLSQDQIKGRTVGGAVRCMYDFALIKHQHAERPEGEAWSCKSYLHFYNGIIRNRPSLLHFDLSFIILLYALDFVFYGA